jgi:pyruvate carboxylase subunit B
VAMEPLSWGTAHADLLTIHEVLKDAGFSVPEINMNAYMEARTLTQEFIDDFLGYYINPKNRLMNSLLIAPGLPGGMMGSLMADLENNLNSINKYMEKKGQPEISQDELLIKLFDEVKHVWPIMGSPPLVTPFSQYVKNAALVNVMQMLKSKERWSLLDDSTWNMLLGKSGRLPGEVGEELKALAKEQGREFFEGNPADLIPDALDDIKKEMEEKGWEFGEDDEELLEYALHPQQYIDYKSGKAKETFLADLAERKTAAAPASSGAVLGSEPLTISVEVDGEKFNVTVGLKDEGKSATDPLGTAAKTSSEAVEVLAPLEGKVFLTKDSLEIGIKVGDRIEEGDIVCYIEAMKVTNAVKSDKAGSIVEICFKDGDDIYDDDVLVRLS